MEEENIQQSAPEAPPPSPEPAPRQGFLSDMASRASAKLFDPAAKMAAAYEERDPLGLAGHRTKLGDHADSIVEACQRDLRRDPQLREQLARYHALYDEVAKHEAAGDRLEAGRVITEIGPIEWRLQKAFDDFVRARVIPLNNDSLSEAYGVYRDIAHYKKVLHAKLRGNYGKS